MADLSKIKLNGTTYNFKDTEARNDLNNKVSKRTEDYGNYVQISPVVSNGRSNLTLTTFGNGTASLSLNADDSNGINGSKITASASQISLTGIVTPTTDTMAANKKYVDDAVAGVTIPTTVSSFTNDSGYQTSTQVQSAINTAIGDINSFEVEVVSALPTSNIKDHTIYFVPQASNSSTHDEYMYINNAWELIGTTSVDLSNYLQTTDIAAWAKAANKPTYTAMEVGALPNTYTAPVTSVNGQTGAVSLSIPTVPTNVSDFTNDAGYLTSYTETDPTVPAWAKAASKPSYTAAEVGAMATTHAANAITSTDITNWNAKSDFSGSYNDLTNKPTIPAAVSVSNTLASGTLIATINGTNIYAPSYINGDELAYGG